MRLLRGAWRLMVGIKDGLALLVLLLFFGMLFTILSARDFLCKVYYSQNDGSRPDLSDIGVQCPAPQ